MNRYTEASKYYKEALACWKKFKEGKDASFNYTKFINLAVSIAALDLPDPFEGKEDIEDAADEVDESSEEPELPFADEDELKQVEEEVVPETKKKFSFRRR